MEEEFLRKYYSVGKLPLSGKLSASLPKVRVKPFTRPGSDLETSLGSVHNMECLTTN